MKGIIQWIDEEWASVHSLKDGKTYVCYYTQFPKNNTLKRGDKVNFTLYTNLYMSQIDNLEVDNE